MRAGHAQKLSCAFDYSLLYSEAWRMPVKLEEWLWRRFPSILNCIFSHKSAMQGFIIMELRCNVISRLFYRYILNQSLLPLRGPSLGTTQFAHTASQSILLHHASRNSRLPATPQSIIHACSHVLTHSTGTTLAPP